MNSKLAPSLPLTFPPSDLSSLTSSLPSSTAKISLLPECDYVCHHICALDLTISPSESAPDTIVMRAN